MRVYLPPVVEKLVSLATVVVAIAAVAFLSVKAWEVLRSDPSLNQIPKVLEQSK